MGRGDVPILFRPHHGTFRDRRQHRLSGDRPDGCCDCLARHLCETGPGPHSTLKHLAKSAEPARNLDPFASRPKSVTRDHSVLQAHSCSGPGCPPLASVTPGFTCPYTFAGLALSATGPVLPGAQVDRARDQHRVRCRRTRAWVAWAQPPPADRCGVPVAVGRVSRTSALPRRCCSSTIAPIRFRRPVPRWSP